MERLSGKTALVTGASRGIGRAIALRLARDGARVAVNYAGNQGAAAGLVSEIESNGGRAVAIQARVGSAAETEKLFTVLAREWDSQPLDILVNNAGMPHFGMVSAATEEEFEEVFGVNTKGTFLVTRAALARMQDGGRIINISSGASRRPGRLFGLYAMSKAALDAMTLALAAELGPRGITVNSIAPGWTATEGNAEARQDEAVVRRVIGETALGRLGTPEDIADAVAFLASGEGRWITGQYLEVSGGFHLV